jgi:CTP:molybdopterin cytidylyltransferase MocA
MPPAVFPREYWPSLSAAQGDRGGRALLSGAKIVHAPPSELRDIDVAADLPTPGQS